MVKETAGLFYQIAADQALEHINKQGKIAGGLVGKTKNPSAMNLFNPFGRTCEELICISTNDVASNEIKNDILSVTMRGSELLTNFVKQRLLPDSTGNLHDPIPQNKSKTFANLTNVHVATPSGKSKIYGTMNYHQHP